MVTNEVTAALWGAGFLIGGKSILTPVAEVTWMGKTVNAQKAKSSPGRWRWQIAWSGGYAWQWPR